MLETEDEMERMPRGIDTSEFREQAVRLRENEGLTIPEVAHAHHGMDDDGDAAIIEETYPKGGRIRAGVLVDEF